LNLVIGSLKLNPGGMNLAQVFRMMLKATEKFATPNIHAAISPVVSFPWPPFLPLSPFLRDGPQFFSTDVSIPYDHQLDPDRLKPRQRKYQTDQ
jgi:hypothetical protein